MTTYFKIRDIDGNVTAKGEAQVDVELPDPTVGIFAESYDIYNIVINNKRLDKQPNAVLENIIIEQFVDDCEQAYVERKLMEYESGRRYY
jgi:hypothetical protein